MKGARPTQPAARFNRFTISSLDDLSEPTEAPKMEKPEGLNFNRSDDSRASIWSYGDNISPRLYNSERKGFEYEPEPYMSFSYINDERYSDGYYNDDYCGDGYCGDAYDRGMFRGDGYDHGLFHEDDYDSVTFRDDDYDTVAFHGDDYDHGLFRGDDYDHGLFRGDDYDTAMFRGDDYDTGTFADNGYYGRDPFVGAGSFRRNRRSCYKNGFNCNDW